MSSATGLSAPAIERAALTSAIEAARLRIEQVTPSVDGGALPARGVIGTPVFVEADIFSDGHDQLGARLIWRGPGTLEEQSTPFLPMGNDRWRAVFTPGRTGRYRFNVEAWLDEWGSYRADLRKKLAAGPVAAVDIEEGRTRLVSTAARAGSRARDALAFVQRVELAAPAAATELLLSDEAAQFMARFAPRLFVTHLPADLIIDVERLAAGFASWYELFPRSQSSQPGSHGTFDDVIARLPALRAMGFDVLYMPPIHPIGRDFRKGPNNSLAGRAGRSGQSLCHRLGGGRPHRPASAARRHGRVPAAAGSRSRAWHGSGPGFCDPVFARSSLADHASRVVLVARRRLDPLRGESAQEVPGHRQRRFLSRTCPSPALWLALRDVVLYWIDAGVRIFRVDNPHTKPLPFWRWLIADIRGRHPDVVFLSEAFTRPAMMYRLAKIGFTQSYTYFIWRNSKLELTDYFTELTTQAPKDFFRPHLFVNTPDINPFFLQTSGRPGFLIRAALAATLSGLWGLYSGFELCESEPLPGREEYLDSEKYQIRQRDWQAPGNIIAEISQLNRIRHENPALQSHLFLRFYNAFNEQVISYGRFTPGLDNFLLILVSLDPHHVQEVQFEVPLWEFGLPDTGALAVEELMRGVQFRWYGKLQHWRFVPQELPFAIFRIRPWQGGG